MQRKCSVRGGAQQIQDNLHNDTLARYIYLLPFFFTATASLGASLVISVGFHPDTDFKCYIFYMKEEKVADSTV